jgi:hypothetical protein
MLEVPLVKSAEGSGGCWWAGDAGGPQLVNQFPRGSEAEEFLVDATLDLTSGFASLV